MMSDYTLLQSEDWAPYISGYAIAEEFPNLHRRAVQHGTETTEVAIKAWSSITLWVGSF